MVLSLSRRGGGGAGAVLVGQPQKKLDCRLHLLRLPPAAACPGEGAIAWGAGGLPSTLLGAVALADAGGDRGDRANASSNLTRHVPQTRTCRCGRKAVFFLT